MALTLTGSKRWPKRKVLHTFAKQHCQLDAQKVAEIEAEVEQAIQQNLALLGQLQQQYADFAPVSERLYTVLTQPML
jgi:serine/threonine-protein kinase HipA